MISKIILMMAITLTGKVMGILRDRMQGIHYGTYTIEGIAFEQAALLPRTFLDIMFASVFSASFIPIFNRYLETKGQEAAFNLAARFIKGLLLITITISLLSIVLAAPLHSLLLDGEALAPETRDLAITLLRIMFPIMIISSLAFSLTGILQSLGQFNIPAAMSIASNGIILAYYFFFIERFGVYGLAIAFLIGWSAQVAIQIPFLYRRGFFKTLGLCPKPRKLLKKFDQNFRMGIFMKDLIKIPKLKFLSNFFKKVRGGLGAEPPRSSDLHEVWRLALPVMVASWLVPVNFLVNTRAAVNLYGGLHGFVSISRAHGLFIVITGLFVMSLANMLFPALSKLAAREDWAAYAAYLRSSLRGMLFVLLPMTFGLMILARPLVRLVFLGGRFQELSVEITATALFFYSLGIVGFGLQLVLSRACFALQDGRGPLFTALLAMGINFVLSFALAPGMEIAGPALASAIAISVAGLGLALRLWRRMIIWDINASFEVGKMLVLAVLMYFAVSAWMPGIEAVFAGDDLPARLMVVVVPAGIGLSFYFVSALILKVPEARMGMEWLLVRLKLKGV